MCIYIYMIYIYIYIQYIETIVPEQCISGCFPLFHRSSVFGSRTCALWTCGAGFAPNKALFVCFRRSKTKTPWNHHLVGIIWHNTNIWYFIMVFNYGISLWYIMIYDILLLKSGVLIYYPIFYSSIYWECHHPNWRTHISLEG